MSPEQWLVVGVIGGALISAVGTVFAARAARIGDDVRELRALFHEHLRDHANG